MNLNPPKVMLRKFDRELLQYLVDGRTGEEIARIIGKSENHLNVMKTRLRDRVNKDYGLNIKHIRELELWALHHNIVNLESYEWYWKV